MIDRYTKVLLTVIAVNMTIMVGWGAAKVFVPEVSAAAVQSVKIINDSFREAIPVTCLRGCSKSTF